jgi:hypothetical protein
VKRNSIKHFKWMLLAMVAVLVAAYLFIPFISQRINEMAGFSGAQQQGNVNENSILARKMIWNVDTDMLKQYWLTGMGPGKLLHNLNEQYLLISQRVGYDVGSYDPHNEYFYDWLCFGLAGITLLLTVLVAHVYTAVVSKNRLYLYLLLILLATFFTESVLARQQGVVFFGVFTSLMFFYSRDMRGAVANNFRD